MSPPNDALVEDRRIYVVDGEYWMVLTMKELLEWRRKAAHLIRYVNHEPCSQVYREQRVKES